MSLQDNLAAGQLALDHVRRSNIRKINHVPEYRTMPETTFREIERALVKAPDSVRNQFRAYCGGLNDTECLQQNENAYSKLADLAKSKQAGHCTEQDAVVIQYLVEKHPLIRPLEIMNLYTEDHAIDHTFVVIGRRAIYQVVKVCKPKVLDPAVQSCPVEETAPGPFDDLQIIWSADTHPTTWGAEAVIVDPWYKGGAVYAATEIETRMFRGWAERGEKFEGTLKPVTLLKIK